MSFMRFSSKTKWEDTDPLYVYMAAINDTSRLSGFDGASPKQVVEVIMRILDQSGELSQGELEKCHSALRKRLRVSDGEVGRNPPSIEDATMGLATAAAYANRTGRDEIHDEIDELYNDLAEQRMAELERQDDE